MQETIPLLRPQLPTADMLLPWLKRIDSNRVYTNFGPLHDEFLGRLIGLQKSSSALPVYGVLTSNATAGLELAISALNLPPASKVAVPAFTFPATATAVQRCGHIPVAFDVDLGSWLMLPEHMPSAPGLDAIKAVVPVSTFGMPQDQKQWSEWSLRNKVPVIIDAAAAFGAQQICGGITAVYSLHATKPLSSGEGGFIATHDPELAARLRAMSNFGIGLSEPTMSTNCKMSEYHAAIGLAHLSMWPQQSENRMHLFKKINQRINSLDGKFFYHQIDTGRVAPSVFCIRTSSENLRSRIEFLCNKNNVSTRRWYLPLITSIATIKDICESSELPNSQAMAKTLIGLPFYLGMPDDHIDRICEIINRL